MSCVAQEFREVKVRAVDVLKQPQPNFEAFKALFTHGVLGLSKAGRPIWVMKVSNNVTMCPLVQCIHGITILLPRLSSSVFA